MNKIMIQLVERTRQTQKDKLIQMYYIPRNLRNFISLRKYMGISKIHILYSLNLIVGYFARQKETE